MSDHIEENKQLKSTSQRTQELPELYSKRIILIFSGLFSVIFGAALLLSNLKKLEEKKGTYQVLLFVFIYVAGLVYKLSSIKAGTNFSLPLNLLGGLILNEYFWNRYIGRETEYEKKSWVKPTLISLAISVPAFLALVYLG
ncbi:hypothetical protein GCM10023115_32450 [Pontixanthobacter gangjinensis]|uniref:Uncharacterized protein n=1 Tax=Christiangramia aestuarii TaxID=1028746 RepID=A0A7K1LPA8_9FLAO|nr:hypothetical protein [Christiangramia aestuarii]MUP42471.1 hypothetical protein [Christiangramia aestuarii]